MASHCLHVQVFAAAATKQRGDFTILQLGSIRGQGLWTMYDSGSSISFDGITFIALPLVRGWPACVVKLSELA